jgi:hypothetical protein
MTGTWEAEAPEPGPCLNGDNRNPTGDPNGVQITKYVSLERIRAVALSLADSSRTG